MIKKSYDYLTGNFYGYVNAIIDTDYGTLIELHIAEWNGDDSWECADWYLDTGDGEPIHVANCNGTDGVDFLSGWYGLEFDGDDDLDEEIREEIDELITSYNPTELYKSARVAEMEEATTDDHEDEFVIVEEANYFQSDCTAAWKNQPNVVKADEENGDELIFETYRDAKNYIDELNNGTYYTNQGEAGRPDYKIYKL